VRFAALLSGGKDSTLAWHLARERGFEPVVGIVVRPEDAESHMFHVPNLDLARAHVDLLGLEPVEVTAPPGEATETEVLEPAFEAAREHGAETVVTGAVASEYQRTRVERAAHRAGLRTHNPLWHVDPREVLDEVASPTWDVRVAGVAAYGLGRDWLGRRLDGEAVAELVELERTHGVHPGGEGGEYETLVLDAPAFEGRLVVEEAEADWERDRGTWRVTAWESEGDTV
jgi:ABC transporter with metal-binding/Fe-S-binding domain ATP-binding protein